MKAEASGYPDWVKSESDRDKYIANYLNDEGIQLEKDKIEKNPGLRTLSKACLNYLYGKFGEKEDKLRKAIISERRKVVDLISNVNIEIHSMFELNSDTVLFSYKCVDQCSANKSYTNVAIAAYVTAHGRIELYRHSEGISTVL